MAKKTSLKKTVRRAQPKQNLKKKTASGGKNRLKRALKPLPTVTWAKDHVRMIDQTLLPDTYKILDLERVEDVWEAILSLRVRGAPAIGVAAAYGLCLGLKEAAEQDSDAFFRALHETSGYLASSRPTAVNLVWALDRMKDVADANAELPPKRLWRRLLQEAKEIHSEDTERCAAMGRHGATLFKKKDMNVLTHCNTGSLATGGIGTALATLLTAASKRDIHVWVDETRPLLQGARLNCWELQRYGVRATLICDNMAATLMAQGRVDAVIVGADRIAANGDFANKIGTYGLAVLCRYHKIPFYCAAPLSTFDWSTPNGSGIPIEERKAEEVQGFREIRWSPKNMPVYNPAFDVTPNRLVTGIVTECGVALKPFAKTLKTWRESCNA